MAQLVTLADLRTRAKQRADMVNSNFLSDSEWNTNINASARELYDLLVTVYSDYYFSTYSFNITAGNDSHALPSDYYKLLGVDQAINGNAGQCSSLRPYVFSERNSYVKPTGPLQGITLYYIPCMPALVNDSDTFDGINGWEEYIVVDAARKALEKEESDISACLQAKAELVLRINGSAVNRDAGAPKRMGDIYKVDPFNYIFQIPGRLHYRVLANEIKFVENYAFGTAYE